MLSGINFLGRFEIRLRKKLLRFSARRSATAMVGPIDFDHAHSPSVTLRSGVT
jgi:hypothetical protein